MKANPLRIFSIVLGLLGGVIELIAVILVAFVKYEYMPYIGLGIAGLGFLLILLALLCAVLYKVVNIISARDVVDQLKRISSGDLSTRQIQSSSPEIYRIAVAVNNLPNERFDPLDEKGETLSKADFKARLDACLSTVVTTRSALLLFALTDKASVDSQKKLEAYLRETYPNALLGEIDGGYGLYLPYVTSADQVEGKVKTVIPGFVIAENPSSLQPISIGLKCVIAFYPDFQREELLPLALAELPHADPLSILRTGESHVEPSTLAGKTVLDAIPYAKYRRAMAAATDAKARRKALRLLIASSGFATGYEAIGLAYYDPSHRAYRLIEELHREGMAPAFKALEKEGYIKEDRLDPYYKIAIGEPFFATNDGLHLPSRPAGIMDSLGLRSIAIRAIGSESEKEGIIYLTSTKAMPDFDYEKTKELETFFEALSLHLLLEKGIAEKERAKKLETLLTTPFRHFVLQLEPTTRKVVHASTNLVEAFPDIEIGKKVPEAILPEDVDILAMEDYHKTLPSLGPGMVHFEVISRTPEITLVLTKQEQNFASYRLDTGLLILNRRALMADLESEFLAEKEGIVLAFRIENADAITTRFEGSTIDEVMSAVMARLSVSALEEGLYRYDDMTLAYLISGGEKDDGRDLAVQIAEALSNPLPFRGKTIQPEISYYVISYPTEASCNFDLESLLRTCFSRVASVGKGRIVPFDEKDEAPLALPRAYKEEALKKALAKGKFPLLFSPVVENSSLRPRFVEAGIGLVLAKGEKPSPDAVRALIHDEKTTSQLEVGEAQSFFEFFKLHGSDLKASSIRGVIFRVSKSSMFSSTYIRTLSKGTKEAKTPKDYITLLVPNTFAEEEKDKFKEFMDNVNSLHIRVVYEKGGEKKSNLLYLPRTLVEEATASSTKASELGQEVAKAREERTNLVLPGISKPEHRNYAVALGIPYGEGPLYGENLTEEEFLETLND